MGNTNLGASPSSSFIISSSRSLSHRPCVCRGLNVALPSKGDVSGLLDLLVVIVVVVDELLDGILGLEDGEEMVLIVDVEVDRLCDCRGFGLWVV
jgi:hypothetical protein